MNKSHFVEVDAFKSIYLVFQFKNAPKVECGSCATAFAPNALRKSSKIDPEIVASQSTSPQSFCWRNPYDTRR